MRYRGVQLCGYIIFISSNTWAAYDCLLKPYAHNSIEYLIKRSMNEELTRFKDVFRLVKCRRCKDRRCPDTQWFIASFSGRGRSAPRSCRYAQASSTLGGMVMPIIFNAEFKLIERRRQWGLLQNSPRILRLYLPTNPAPNIIVLHNPLQRPCIAVQYGQGGYILAPKT